MACLSSEKGLDTGHDFIDLVSDDDISSEVLSTSKDEEDLEAFLDKALKEDPILKRVLDEALRQIIRAAVRLCNLQRNKGRGHQKFEEVNDSRNPENVISENLEGSSLTPVILKVFSLFSSPRNSITSDHIVEDSGANVENLTNPPVPADDIPETCLHAPAKNLIGRHRNHKANKIGSTVTENSMRTPLKRGRKKGKEVVKNVGCYFCQKSCKTSQGLEYHLRTHLKEFPFSCSLCGKEFPQKQNLDYHHTRRHLKTKPFKCPQKECKSAFATKAEVKRHSGIHMTERTFCCNFQDCVKAFTHESHMRYHLQGHKKRKQFLCKLCGKRFSQKGHLKDHKRRHVKKKPFKCPQEGCPSKFATLFEANQHNRIHTGEKPFLCCFPNCGKAFTQTGARVRHHRRHSGDKQFAGPLQEYGKVHNSASSLT